MSPKAVFYILTGTTLKSRDLYACRIIEKAYSSDKKVYVHLSNSAETQNFDTQLWTFRDIGFIPHEIYDKNLNNDAPILIGYDLAFAPTKDILVNLGVEIDAPAFYHQFNHIIEVIPNDSSLKTIARNRYQIYKNNGYQIETFNIASAL